MEADAAISPTTNFRPSVVLKLGHSETFTQLRLWLVHIPAVSQFCFQPLFTSLIKLIYVELVILNSITPPLAAYPNLPKIELELWRAFGAPQPQRSPREARMVWSVDWTLNAPPL